MMGKVAIFALLLLLTSSAVYAQEPCTPSTNGAYGSILGLQSLCNNSNWAHITGIEVVEKLPANAEYAVVGYNSGYGCSYNGGSGRLGLWVVKHGDKAFPDMTVYFVGGCPGGPELPNSPDPPTCDAYKNLFDPPAPDCDFGFIENGGCTDGAGNVIEQDYLIRASDGRVVEVMTPRAPGLEGAECANGIMPPICVGPEGQEADCFEPLDLSDGDGPMSPGFNPGGSSGGGSDDCQKHITINGNETSVVNVCDKDGNSFPNSHTDDWFDDCVYKDSNGVYMLRDSCRGDAPNGGSTGGGGSGNNGGNSGGGEGSGGGYSDQLNDILGQLKNLNDKVGSGGGGGGGSGGGGKDYSGQIDGLGDKLDELNKTLKEGQNYGTTKEISDAVNSGGFGDEKGEYSLDRGVSEHKTSLDKLANSGPAKEIKDHQFIETSGAVCSISTVLFKRNVTVSFCEYAPQLNFFGDVLMKIVGLIGLVLILKR